MQTLCGFTRNRYEHKDPSDGVGGYMLRMTAMHEFYYVSFPVESCGICVSVCLCLLLCIYMETLPQTVEGYIMASVRAC